MEEKDLDSIVELETKCFPDPWAKKDFLYELKENPFSFGYVVEKDEKVIGYCLLWTTFELAQVVNIAVDPAFRHCRLGYQMMETMMEKAREENCEFMSLEARASNQSALSLYEKCGFIQVNVSKGYYSDGEDAIVMTVAL